ncbi:ABC transporter permease [Candidatus Babeliales bacterium]|nr:ABC transporter permease [Candidatus Babeliales bacterium]
MNLAIIFRSALKSLASHKIRSLLTTLGIIIGVVAIVCVMSIGEGAKHRINQEIQKLGTNFIIVLSSSQKKLTSRSAPLKPLLTPKDLHTIKNECDNIALISPGIQQPSKIMSGNKSWETTLGGVAQNYSEIRNWKLTDGDFFTHQDMISGNKVAVVGMTVKREVFGNENPVGKTLRIKRIPFLVIGTLSELGKRPDGTDQDDTVLIPVTTMRKRIMGGKELYFALIMSAKDKDRMQQTSNEIRSILRLTHKIPECDDDDFTMFTQEDVAQASDAATKIMNLLLFFVALISLIVGGIGIMNIMLVSVTERTREIGIRMALGATTKSILNQFIFEAITICLLGGLLGLLIGVGCSVLIGVGLGWPVFISKISLAISLVTSASIGLFFGYYPAYKASRLNPVDALAER